MSPSVYEVLCEEYTRHVNELRMERSAASQGYRSELDKLSRDQDRLVQAILDGVPGSRVKDRMAELEARKAKLEALLAEAHEEPVLLHPNLSQLYRQQVARLVEALNDEHHRTQAAEIIRGLVDRIELTPVWQDGKETLSITLHGDLAGILGLAARAKGPRAASGPVTACTKLVAGAGFEPATFRL
jgi:site-specific DNA recombinase